MNFISTRFTILLILFSVNTSVNSLAQEKSYVLFAEETGAFPLVTSQEASTLMVSESDFPGVLKVAGHLQNDILKVTGKKPEISSQLKVVPRKVVVIGTLGKSKFIDQLVGKGKLDVSQLKAKWEKFIIQTIERPFPGVEQALVIAGSDKRGTIYGMYDLSKQIGVHPWHFWADIPAEKHPELFVKAGTHTLGEPKVKYRGIFINDEAPALTGWAYERYGGFNAQFYDKVFELILRMKGNYLWPAMWGRMFYVDDPKNTALADEYGIVMGTSHHEPLTRAHAEWKQFGEGDWNYNTNPKQLEEFWRKGMERMGDTETIVSVGMRGDGDEPMTEGTAIDLLENIVEKQREIIAETTGKPASETPQMWALYKEVQEYYDKGMRVPDDVTLLLCDDNWGNIRKLPETDAPEREGGYGIYYHFDYVGGPRNYKWLNTNQIERTWEQMNLAYEHGVNKVWIVNVGDIKPMEFPTQFFLDLAWNPESFTAEKLPDYYVQWTTEIFGTENSIAIAEIMQLYTKYNARRKPELLDADTYSLIHYNEAERINNEYQELLSKAASVKELVPSELQDTYYQLVLFPVAASANLNELYFATAKNRLYAKQGRALTNTYADKVAALFQKDAELTKYYHTELADGKWNHMMSQTHIGYTYWQQPEKNSMPEVERIDLSEKAEMGIVIPGSERVYSKEFKKAVLPIFDSFNNPRYELELFNKGKTPFDYQITGKEDWVILSQRVGRVDKQEKIAVSIDWSKAPEGESTTKIIVKGADENVEIAIPINKIARPMKEGFLEANGYVSMHAESYSDQTEGEGINWITIPNLGKTKSGVTTSPTAIKLNESVEKSPKLSYNINFLSEGEVKVHLYFSPTLNYTAGSGFKYAVGFNDEKPQVVNFHDDASGRAWNQSVADNIKILTTSHRISKGNHTLNYHALHNGLVLQKIVIDTGGLQETYLGPPESFEIKE